MFLESTQAWKSDGGDSDDGGADNDMPADSTADSEYELEGAPLLTFFVCNSVLRIFLFAVNIALFRIHKHGAHYRNTS